jgi:Domain of unknown function (DUF4476)/FG-GAP-like repeat
MKKIIWLMAVLGCNLCMAQPTSNPNFLSDFGFTNGGWRNGETVRLAADVNGDGKADVIGYSGNVVRVAFSNGTSFSPQQLLNQDFNGWSYQNHVRTAGDINGDGKADLIAFGDEGTYAAISTGKGFGLLHLILNDFGNVNGGWDAVSTVRCVGDVNGDGKTDVVGFSGGSVRVSFSNGAALSPNRVLNSDFEGWSYTNHVRTVADVDGDGKADLVGFGSAGTYVCFSTGTGFESGKLAINDFGTDQGWDARTMKRIMADMNGDGKADIVGYNTEQVVVSYSTGRTFEAPKVISYDFSNKTGFAFDKYAVTAADVDGNKSADLIGFGDQGVIVQLTPGAAPVKQVMTTGDRLCCDQVLALGGVIYSPNRRYFLVFQEDRNLVLYKGVLGNANPLWATATNNLVDRCVMQADGNLVLYKGSKAVWASNTNGNPNASLVLQDDGNLVIYTVDGRAIWATNTVQSEQAPVMIPVTAPAVIADSSPCSMPEASFNGAVHAIEAQSFRDSKMKMAKQAIKGKCLSLDQVRTLAKLFAFEDQTLEFLKYAYDFTNSKSDYYTLGDIFSFDSNVQNFTAFLEAK